MTFERAWVLLLCWLPLAWAAWDWRRSPRRTALVLKALALAAVLLALAEPRLTVFESKVAVALLVDTSASVSPADLTRASDLATRIERNRGRHWTRVIPFARSARNTLPDEISRTNWKLQHTSGESGRGTNLESAIREALAAMPAGMVPRIALVSDGKENLGSISRAAWQLRELRVPVDTFPLEGFPRPQMRLESVIVPSQVFTGERFPIDLRLVAPGLENGATATVDIRAEGKQLGATKVELQPGMNHLRVNATVNAVGATNLSGVIGAPGVGDVHFEYAVTLRRPKALLISQDPPNTETHLLRTLQANRFEVTQSRTGVPEDLSPFQLIIINNWDMQAVPPAKKAQVEEFVKQGGGLLWIAGERNVYVENKGSEDPLERTLPAKLSPPRLPEGTCVVLIVDKSSSMEGKKMELARLAAIGVIENLRPMDQIGVLIFDNSFQWVVPIRRAEDRTLIKRLIAGVTPDGGTQIAPALSEAYRRILPVNAIYKHVVLLTDGISEEGDSIALAREASASQVTISTVGLGQDVNRAYLEKVASFSKGRSYFLNDPSGLEQILLRDVMEHTGATAVEKPVRAVTVKQAEILEGVGMEAAPPLLGYVRFESRSTADPVLNVEKDPLLVRWQYELGRAAVFTSDVKSRWASQWLTWNGFDRFWANVFRDLLPHAQESEATAEYDSANDELVVEYRLGKQVDEPETIPDVFVLGPEGFQHPMQIAKVATGHYRGRVSIGRAQGLFRVRPLADSRAFPEVGFYREEDELTQYGSDEFLLRQIAESTGGRYSPDLNQVFDSGGRTIPATMQLWPGLLAAAIALNLVELILRKI
ncbi:MAG: VWA domain-containing protein [Bryobacteraceae bacterium]